MINVKELTDVELNRAMVWLYPPKQALVDDNGTHTGFIGVRGIGYLQDWSFTMPLLVEYRLWLQPAKSCRGWFCYDNEEHYCSQLNQNPLRAACEVLVQIKLEQK